jgi:hypothetical protein
VNDLLNTFESKRLRHRVVFCEWDNAWCYDFAPASFSVRQHSITFPRAAGAAFTSSVSELHAGDAALLMNKTSDAGQFIDVFVLPDAEILRADAAFRQNGRSLRQNESSTAHSTTAEVNEMPIIGEAVFAGVFAHGRDEDPVGESEIAQLKRVEQM